MGSSDLLLNDRMRLRNEDEELDVFFKLNEDVGTVGTVDIVVELRRSDKSEDRLVDEGVREDSGVDDLDNIVDVFETTVSEDDE